MWSNTFSRYKKTDFNGGGLLQDHELLAERRFLTTSPNFVAPRKIDNRDMCLRTDNQGNTPQCAAYSTAGFIEFQHWKIKHYPEQINPDPIYQEAKRIDGDNNPGTYLKSATQAVINLGLMDGTPKHIDKSELDIQFAIHQYGVCIGGFMITDEWNLVEKSTGKISILSNARQRGGHAVLLNGYDYEGLYIQNSWSEDWGIYGFAILPWELFNKQILDAMVIA